MKRRHAILLLGGASSGAMSIGTGAFSSVEADRGVEVSVVDDDEAYLGLDVENRIATVGRPAEVVEITNSFADTLSLDVSVEDTNEVVDEIAVSDESPGNEFFLTLNPGESVPVAITCGQTGEAKFTLDFSGETDGATVEKTRTFENIECPVSSVKFNGNNGNVKIEGEFTDLEVIINTGPRSETLSSGENKKAVIDRSGGEIDSVTIGETVYKRVDS
jgi:hypothetical protein